MRRRRRSLSYLSDRGSLTRASYLLGWIESGVSLRKMCPHRTRMVPAIKGEKVGTCLDGRLRVPSGAPKATCAEYIGRRPALPSCSRPESVPELQDERRVRRGVRLKLLELRVPRVSDAAAHQKAQIHVGGILTCDPRWRGCNCSDSRRRAAESASVAVAKPTFRGILTCDPRRRRGVHLQPRRPGVPSKNLQAFRPVQISKATVAVHGEKRLCHNADECGAAWRFT